MTTETNGGCSVAISVRDVLLLILEADKYPRLGNEDWPVAAALEREALERAKTSVPSADDPPEFQRWLQALLRPSLTADEREEIIWAMYDYFEPSDSP